MDLPWGTPEPTAFATVVGLITSDGPVGPDIAAIEWAHQLSYKPGLIAVSVNFKDATHENIEATKEFGVSIAADDQNVLASTSGNLTGRNVDKIGLLKELGFTFREAVNIKPLLVEGAVLTLECKLIQQMKLGDHTTFVGEVLAATVDETKSPLLYHRGKYWKLGEQVHKPAPEDIAKQVETMEKYKR